MHIVPPRVSLHSLKEFGAHYLMIVLSILTALGLEAAIENMHHHHAAEAARRAIELELRVNLAEVQKNSRANAQSLQPINALAEELTRKIESGEPRPQLVAAIAQRVKASPINIGLYFPSLRHEAWDVAVANQAASYLEPADLARYASIYAEQRDVTTALPTLFLDAPRFVDAMTDARMGAADPRDFVRVLNQAAAAVGSMRNRLDSLQQDLARALAPDAAASGAAAG